jgi:uncharacterized membrane protein
VTEEVSLDPSEDATIAESGGGRPPSTSLRTSDERRARWLSRLPLAALVVGAAALYYLISAARFEAFYGANWDLGINMQLLWSNTHGHLLYESGDFETTGVSSFLFIHTAYIAIPVSYLYALAPSAYTLFALQAAVVAFSAVPLYLLGRSRGLREPVLWAAILVYLISFPVLSAILYDFHWESFFPAEFLWTFYLWDQRRYRLALLPILLGLLTLEVFPFLLLGLVLYGAYPWLRRLVRRPVGALRELRSSWPQVRPWAGLAVLSVVAYVALRISEHNLVPALVGVPISGYGSQLNNATNALFSFKATWKTIGPSLVYWSLLYAAFGLVPLLVRPRSQLINLPWFFASVFTYPGFSRAFGDQYAFVALAPLAIGFVEGLAVIGRQREERPLAAPDAWGWLLLAAPFSLLLALNSVNLLAPTDATVGLVLEVMALSLGVFVALWLVRWCLARRAPGPGPPPNAADHPEPKARRFARRGWALGGVFVVLIAANLVFSPLNPGNFQASNQPGYAYPSQSNPAFGYLPKVTSEIPPGAVVLASNNLFPFVANNVRAYSLSWWPAPLPYLPFNASHLPEYALLSSSQISVAPSFLVTAVFNESVYGLQAMLYYDAYPGSVYLFHLGFTGSTQVWQVTPFPDTMIYCPSDFALGPSGRVVPQAGTQCGSEIASMPSANLVGRGGNIWYGPYVNLLPGSYEVTLSLRGQLNASLPPPDHGLVVVNANGYGVPTYWYSTTVQADQLNSTEWTSIAFYFNITHPVSGAEFRGYLALHGPPDSPSADGAVQLNYIEVQRL